MHRPRPDPRQVRLDSPPVFTVPSNTFEKFELELGLRSVKYSRTYRPSWISSKVTEAGELFFDLDHKQQRARPVDEVMIRRKHGLYVPFKVPRRVPRR